MQGIMERLKVIAEVKVEPEATAEQLQAIKNILIKAGLLVDIDGREITILERVLNGQHREGSD